MLLAYANGFYASGYGPTGSLIGGMNETKDEGRPGHDDVRPELWVYRGGRTFLEELGSRLGFPDMFERTFRMTGSTSW